MSYPLFVFVRLQRIVHKAQEVGRHHQVVFQHNHPSVGIDLRAYAIDDVAGKTPVLGAFDKCNLFKASDAPDVPAHFVHIRTVCLVSGLVGIDKEAALYCLSIGLQRFDNPACMFGAVVDEKENRSVHALMNN